MPGCPGIIPALPRCCPVVVHPFVNPVVNPLLNPFVKLCVAHHRHTLPDTSHSTKEHALAACWVNEEVALSADCSERVGACLCRMDARHSMGEMAFDPGVCIEERL